MELKDKVAVVTGASRGLGAAIAEVLAVAGAKVVICSRTSAALAAVRKKIEDKGGACSDFVVDVTKNSQVKKFVSKIVRDYGRIDALVNNAGAVHKFNVVEKIAEQEYELCMRTNVDSVFHFLQAVVPVMKKQGSGMIVNVSSGAGKRAHAGLSVYAASKFAVEALTQATARELDGTTVKCVAICPGGINTGMRAEVFGREDAGKQQSPYAVAEIVRGIIAGKVGVPNGGGGGIKKGGVAGGIDNLSQ